MNKFRKSLGTRIPVECTEN